MILSDFQKDICRKVCKGKVYDIPSFIKEFEILQEVPNNEPHNLGVFYPSIYSNCESISYNYNHNNNKLHELQEFVVLWKLFEKKDYFITANLLRKLDFVDTSGSSAGSGIPYNSNPNKLPPYIREFINQTISINECDRKRICPSPVFLKFVENNFFTDEELAFKEQQDAYRHQEELSRKSLKRSTIASYVSIGVAILTILINAFMYTNQRKVEITNLDRKIEVTNLDSAFNKVLNANKSQSPPKPFLKAVKMEKVRAK